MIYRNDIIGLKQDLAQNIGQKILVKGSLGRSKTYEEEAIIEQTYQNLFTVKYGEEFKNLPSTYSYTDVLTRTVELSVYDGEGYFPLMPAPIEKKRRKRKVKNSL